MTCRSLGQRLFDHQIQPPCRAKFVSPATTTPKSEVDQYFRDWVSDQVTRRVHHGAVALAHVPAGLVDLAGAIICSLGSVLLAGANAITFNYFDGMKNLSISVNAQTFNFWMGVGHTIPGIFSHALGIINPYTTADPHTLFDQYAIPPKGAGGDVGALPTNLCMQYTVKAIHNLKNPLVKHIAARVAALLSLIVIPIVKLADLAPGLLYTLAAIATLGTWQKAHAKAYQNLYSVCTIPQFTHAFFTLLINPSMKELEGYQNSISSQEERSSVILKANRNQDIVDFSGMDELESIQPNDDQIENLDPAERERHLKREEIESEIQNQQAKIKTNRRKIDKYRKHQRSKFCIGRETLIKDSKKCAEDNGQYRKKIIELQEKLKNI